MATYTYKCPNCSGGLIFQPETQDFRCEYCSSAYSEAELAEMNRQAEAAGDKVQEQQAAPEQPGGAYDAVYSCSSCGAEIVAEETTATTFCFYCHNPVVLTGRLTGEYKPDSVIPFTVTKEQAVEKFMEWANKKWFVSKGFVNKKNVEHMVGMYFPHWLIDCQVDGAYSGEATRVRSWRSGDTEYTETKYYQVIREGNIDFRDILKNALQMEHTQLVRSIEPFNVEEAKPFVPSYLTGFQAEKRNVERDQLAGEVQNEVNINSGNILRGSVQGYTTVSGGNVNVRPRGEEWKYTLLPVWILTYRGKGNSIYYFAMNGQTGKVNGNLPLDKRKLGIVSGGIAAATFVLGLIGWLGGMI